MLKSAIASAAKFQRNEKGNVAVMFGISVIAVTMMVGVAVDFGRAHASKSKVAAAADAAALAAVKGMRLEGMSDDAAIALAERVFDENMKRGSANWTQINSLSVQVDRASGRATVNVDSSVPTTFTAISGITRMPSSGSASALFESRDIEVSLQLDLTGSMCNFSMAPCTDHPKIQGLKDATKDLVNILIPDNPQQGQTIRLAYAPFTAGVNLGAYQSSVTGGVTTSSGCVYERSDSTKQATDDAPTGADRYMVRADLQAAPHNVSSPRACPTASVVPLTSNKQLLLDTVDSYVADGFTGGHNGTAWAWNMLSPNFANVWPTDSAPAAYNDANTFKNVILMTDGEYNTMNGKNWNATQVSTVAVSTCTAMKTAGIRIYTVGFALGGNQTAIDTLAACASSPGDFIQASTPDELRAAFRNIANNIVRLRLTN